MNLTPSANHLQLLWLLRAEETRSLVEQVSHPEAKRIVLEIAKRCERLAELVVLVHSVMAAASLSISAPYPPAGIAASTATAERRALQPH
jgi:hypothetical protein